MVLKWKQRHKKSVYAIPASQVQPYMDQILTMGPLKASLQRQRDKFGATTLAKEIPECRVVELSSLWEVRKDTVMGLTEETTLVRRHRPPTEWTMYHPDVYSQKHISDWISDSAFLCGQASNYVLAIRPRGGTELSRVGRVRRRSSGGPPRREQKHSSSVRML